MGGYSVYDVVAYLLYRLGGRVEGVKKLMKLVFLSQYSRRPLSRSVVKLLYQGEPLARASFYIWSYGPLSNEVYEAIEELPVDDTTVPVVIQLPPGLRPRELAERLPPPVRQRLDRIANRYGSLTGGELEKQANRILLLDESLKDEYRGLDVDEYIHRRGLRLRELELAPGR